MSSYGRKGTVIAQIDQGRYWVSVDKKAVEAAMPYHPNGLKLEPGTEVIVGHVILAYGPSPRKEEVLSGEKPKLKELVRYTSPDGTGKYLIKRRDGTVVEWPSFVLGARDVHAEVALRAYADSIAQDPDCEPTLPDSIRRLADEFRAYREKHGRGDPTRGLHRKDDPATIEEMRKGKSG